jgi:H+/Cl- antiporter ClcA
MGASLARTLGKLQGTRFGSWLWLTDSRQRLLLMAGVSGGFGSLFGTPVAGAVFGMEVISIGKLHYEGLLICTAAGFVGDWACRALGAPHARYLVEALPWNALLGAKLLLFALPVAVVAAGFSEAAQGLARWVRGRVPNPVLRPFFGGLALLGLVLILRRTDFLNLGTVWFPRVLVDAGPVPSWAFAAKMLFTVVALGFGFKGGEVTPLFAIGALLGAACAPLLGVPVPYLGALGFAAVFATASNTPVASLLLGAELFGASFLAPLALICFPAYILVGHRGIYGGHRVETPKG